ncbi:MAG: ankyrin repeat domain-containing protein [Enhygromyxa sp.]
MSDLYALRVAARPDDHTVELDIEVVHPDAMHIPATPGFALMLLHDRASGDAPLGREVDLETVMDSGWARANACAFVDSVELISSDNQPPPEALDDDEHRYWQDPAGWLKGRLRIRATHPAWISHLPERWDSAAFDPADRYDPCPPARPDARPTIVLEAEVERSEGFLPVPRLAIASELGPDAPELLWVPRHGARAYEALEPFSGAAITLAKLREWIGRPVLWHADGETRVGIVGRIEEARAALVSITSGSRSTRYHAPEELEWIGPAAYRQGTPRLAPPLTLERLLDYASVAALVSQVDGREATLELHLLAREPGMQPQLGAADVLRLIALSTRPGFSGFDGSTSKLGRTLQREMQERELSWDSGLYPLVARGFIESFEAEAPARPRAVDLDELDRKQVIEFIEQRRWPRWTVKLVVHDPAWLEHLEHAGVWAVDFEELEPAQDWDAAPIEWDPTLDDVASEGDVASSSRRQFELPGPATKLDLTASDDPRAVLRDHGLWEDVTHLKARDNFETACKTGTLAAVRAYVALGVDIESHADISKETPLIRAAEGDQPEVVRILAAAGVDLQGRDRGGDTAVMTAVNWNNPAVLRALIEVGADLDAPDNYDNLPLVKALAKGSEELVELLLEGGASPNAGAATRDSALQWCVREHDTERLRALLAREGAEVDQATAGGDTLLHLAVLQQDDDAVAALIDAGAELERPNRWGWTARDIAEAVHAEDIAARLERAGAALRKADAVAYFEAIEQADREAVVEALERGLEVDTRSYSGATGLMLAISEAQLELAELLRSRGADINARDGDEDNALTHARSTPCRRWLLEAGIEAAYRDSKGALRQPGVEAVLDEDDHELLALLLDARTNFSDLSDLSACHSSLIWGDYEDRLEARARTLRTLGAAGADLEACTDEGTSLLMGYISRGFEAPVMTLLEVGVDIDHADQSHATALNQSCGAYSEHELQARITRALLAHEADYSKTDWLGRSAWDAAKGVDNDECVAALEQVFEQTLVDALADCGREQVDAAVFEALARRSELESFLHWVRKGEHAIVRGLLAAGFDPKAPPHDHRGLRPGKLPLTTAITAGDEAMVEILLEGGVDPNLAQLYGSTAMSYAISERRADVVERLLAAGADPQPVDDFGYTPMATAAAQGNLELLELLVRAGASVQPQASGPSPLHSAVRQGQFEAAQWLLARGADIDARQEGRKTALHLAIEHEQVELALALIAAGADPDVQTSDEERITPLIQATKKGDLELIEALLAAGADPHVQDSEGQSAIDYASYREELRALFPGVGDAPQLERVERELPPLLRAVHLGDRPAFTEALAAAEDVDVRNYRGDTALMLACGLGHHDMVEALLEVGAEISAANALGDTPWTYAFGDEPLRRLIEGRGAAPSMDTLNQMAGQAMRRDAAIEAIRAGDIVRVSKQIDALELDVDLIGRVRPLRLARERGDEALVELLLAKGADPELA